MARGTFQGNLQGTPSRPLEMLTSSKAVTASYAETASILGVGKVGDVGNPVYFNNGIPVADSKTKGIVDWVTDNSGSISGVTGSSADVAVRVTNLEGKSGSWDSSSKWVGDNSASLLNPATLIISKSLGTPSAGNISYNPFKSASITIAVPSTPGHIGAAPANHTHSTSQVNGLDTFTASVKSDLAEISGKTGSYAPKDDYLPIGGGTITGSLVINNDLTVKGTTVSIDAQNLNVKDKLILVASGSNTRAAADGAGIAVPTASAGEGGAARIQYDGTANVFTASVGFKAPSFTGSLRGDVTGTASFATSASKAVSASHSNTATSASEATHAVSASEAVHAISASHAVNAKTALTASYLEGGASIVVNTASYAKTASVAQKVAWTAVDGRPSFYTASFVAGAFSGVQFNPTGGFAQVKVPSTTTHIAGLDPITASVKQMVAKSASWDNVANTASAAYTAASQALATASVAQGWNESASYYAAQASASMQNARTYATNTNTALTQANAASQSAKNAASAANTASGSAKTAATVATNWSLSASNAANIANAASASAQSASNAANVASQSAKTAATTAQGWATSASNYASTASGSMEDARFYSSQAATNATLSSTYAVQSSASAQLAAASASAAHTAKSSAVASASVASQSAYTAATYATAASASSGVVYQKAQEASASAAAAAGSATSAANAVTAANTASGSAKTSATTATDAATAANNASASAKSAQTAANAASASAKTYATNASASAALLYRNLGSKTQPIFLSSSGPQLCDPYSSASVLTASYALVAESVKDGAGLVVNTASYALDAAIKYGGHYSPSASGAGTSGSSTARYYVKTIKVDGKGHVVGVTTGNETVTNTDRYVNTAAFASTGSSGANGVKMTLTRAGSDTTQVTATIPVAATNAAGVMTGAQVTNLNSAVASASVAKNAMNWITANSGNIGSHTGSYLPTAGGTLTGALTTKDVTVQGNLYVSGTTTTVNTSDLVVKDKLILVSSGSTTQALSDGAGIAIQTASAATTAAAEAASARFQYRSSDNHFTASVGIVAPSFTGSLSGKATSAGSADSATVATGLGVAGNTSASVAAAIAAKWTYNENTIKAVKVTSASRADSAASATTATTASYNAAGASALAWVTANSSSALADTKVTSAANHYTPAKAGTSGSTTARYYIKTIDVDAKGHVTGVTTGNETVTNTDTKVTAVGNHYTPAQSTAKSVSSGQAVVGIGVDAAGHVVSVTGSSTITSASRAVSAASADSANLLKPVDASGNSTLDTIQAAFDSVPKSKGIALRGMHGSHDMAFGWFLEGYSYENAYGGWFVSQYGNPHWVGVNNGSWIEGDFITTINFGSSLAPYTSSWASAAANSHTHSNKSVLDGITSTKVSNWDTAYGWGNHANAGYVKSSGVTSVGTGLGLTGGTITSTGTIEIVAGFSTWDNTIATWGTLTSANGYSSLLHWASADGGGMTFAYKGGQISAQLDGYFYQNEGRYRVLDTSDTSSLSVNYATSAGKLSTGTTGNVGQAVYFNNGTPALTDIGQVACPGTASAGTSGTITLQPGVVTNCGTLTGAVTIALANGNTAVNGHCPIYCMVCVPNGNSISLPSGVSVMENSVDIESDSATYEINIMNNCAIIARTSE